MTRVSLTATQQRILGRRCRTRGDLHPLVGRERRSGYAMEQKGLGTVVTTATPHEVWSECEGVGYVPTQTDWYFKEVSK